MRAPVSILRLVAGPLAMLFCAAALGDSADPNTAPQVEAVTIDTSQTREPISPYIYGQFIEHLGRCIYGGIWAEMLEDRKFYFPIPTKGALWKTTREGAKVLASSPWHIIGSTDVKMVEPGAFCGKHSPHIQCPGGGTAAGIYQEELGVLKGKEYRGYIFLAGDSSVAPVTIKLSWGDAANQSQSLEVKKVHPDFTKVPFQFTAGADTENARLTIEASGRGTLKIGCVSLMPADNVEGFRKDTLTLLRELNSPVYRWPGGNFVSGYDWRDGLGDRDRRPTRTNPAWTGIEPNDVGMHEFMRLCELIHAEAMVAVNTGFGDAYSAADEVEYANGSSSTRMGRLRAANGRSKPFGVKFWCVGNEMWGRWQLGYMQLNHYVLKHNWIEQKMRDVDPSIITIGSGDLGSRWTQGMLTNCAAHMNLISEHFYCRSKDSIPEHVRQIPDNVRRVAEAHRQFREDFAALNGKDIRVSLDEWNYWYGPHVFGELGTRYFLKDALGIAAGLHEYFRSTDIISMASYAQTVNVIGCIKTTKTHADFDSTGLPLMLYRREFGTVPVKVDGANPTNGLDISAALTSDKKSLTIGVVNPFTNAVQMRFSFSSAKPSAAARTWVITADDPMASNQPGESRRVDVHDDPRGDLNGVVSVKPLSITLWKAPIR